MQLKTDSFLWLVQYGCMEKSGWMHRDVYAAKLVPGDYILSFTGLTWNVLRHMSDGAAMSVSTGDRDRKKALARVRSLSETDGADGWEADGDKLFRQIVRFRR